MLKIFALNSPLFKLWGRLNEKTKILESKLYFAVEKYTPTFRKRLSFVITTFDNILLISAKMKNDPQILASLFLRSSDPPSTADTSDSSIFPRLFSYILPCTMLQTFFESFVTELKYVKQKNAINHAKKLF